MALAAERYRLGLPQPGAEAPYPAAPGCRAPAARPAPAWAPPPDKDYSVPLHVDCSVEYELPDCAKPPQGVKIEPLLMIHPAHFRRLDSLRRCPFVNNLPVASGGERLSYELPPPRPAAPPAPPAQPGRRSCRAPSAAKPRAPRRPAALRESPERAPQHPQHPQHPQPQLQPQLRDQRRWPPAAPEPCCKGAMPSAEAAEYWGGGGREPPAAPREGDTPAEVSHFGKCPKPRAARQRALPYAPEPCQPAAALAHNCDKTFEMLQGNRLISPFHAKMFSSESVYRNYPIVMYK